MKKQKTAQYVSWAPKVMLLLMITLCIAVGAYLLNAPKLEEYHPTAEMFNSAIVNQDGIIVERLQRTDRLRQSVALDEISESFRNKVIEALDPEFGERSAYGELFCRSEKSLTLNLLRGTLLLDENGEAPTGKPTLRERYLAFRLAKQEDRDWILEAYLNTADFGRGIRGIYEAAYGYFGKTPDNLSKNEEDTLVILLRNPEKGSEKTLRCKTEPDLNWFEDALVESLLEELEQTCLCTEDEAWEKIYSGGYTIYETKNEELQTLCEGLSENKNYIVADEQVSIVMIDRSTGGVAAIVGGRVRRDPDDTGIYGGYNRALELRRNPGMAATIPVVFGTALSSGDYTLGTIIDDAPCIDSKGREVDNPSGSHHGRITLDESISTANVVAAYKVSEALGEEAIKNCIEKLQFDVSQGTVVTAATSMEMAEVYNTIANGGVCKKPVYYSKITDALNRTVFEADPKAKGEQVFSSSAAALLASSLERVLDGDTYQKVSTTKIAWTSCSTDEKRNVWFVGFSPYYTCCVWGGNDDSSPQASGDYVRAIWRNIMEEAHRKIPEARDAELFDPQGLVSESICTKCGLLEKSGLCANSRQGDKTEVVYYKKGTEPKKNCDCHIKMTICRASDAEAGGFCPDDTCTSGVFLTTGTKGTDDESFSAESAIGHKCNVHTSLLDKFFN